MWYSFRFSKSGMEGLLLFDGFTRTVRSRVESIVFSRGTLGVLEVKSLSLSVQNSCTTGPGTWDDGPCSVSTKLGFPYLKCGVCVGAAISPGEKSGDCDSGPAPCVCMDTKELEGRGRRWWELLSPHLRGDDCPSCCLIDLSLRDAQWPSPEAGKPQIFKAL